LYSDRLRGTHMSKTCDSCQRSFELVGNVARSYVVNEEFGVLCPACAELLTPGLLDEMKAIDAALDHDDENLDDESD
jgi:hypothetical protein